MNSLALAGSPVIAHEVLTVYDTIGLLGSFVISAGTVPQIFKVIRTKSAGDISFTFQVLYLVYGFSEGLWPVWIPCLLEFMVNAMFLLAKLCFNRSREENPETTNDIDMLVASMFGIEL